MEFVHLQLSLFPVQFYNGSGNIQHEVGIQRANAGQFIHSFTHIFTFGDNLEEQPGKFFG